MDIDTTSKKIIVAAAIVGIGLLLFPPTQYCNRLGCENSGHVALWDFNDQRIDFARTAAYLLAIAAAAGLAIFIRKK
jgi:hypothetical protein